MLPYSLQRACNKLVDAPKFDAKTKQWTEPTYEHLVSLFLQILEVLESCRDDSGYPLYVRTVFGYRRLIERDATCPPVDNRMIALVLDRSDVLPSDAFEDRLPPGTRVYDVMRSLLRNRTMRVVTPRELELLCAD